MDGTQGNQMVPPVVKIMAPAAVVFDGELTRRNNRRTKDQNGTGRGGSRSVTNTTILSPVRPQLEAEEQYYRGKRLLLREVPVEEVGLGGRARSMRVHKEVCAY